MLLALRNDRGTVAGGTMYVQAVGGAILAELLLRGRITTVAERRSTYAVIADPTPTGNPELDECLAKMRTAKKRRKLQSWIFDFARLKGSRHRIAAGLAEQGILRSTEEQVLVLFTRRIYPELDPTVERAIVERLEKAVFSDGGAVDPRTTVLVALAHHSGLLRANLDRRRLKTRKARIDEIIQGDAIGRATKEAIQAVQAAVLMAAIMPAVIASSS